MEAKKILKALSELKPVVDKTIAGEAGDYEDIHEFVESYVIKRAGAAGKKLQTGRSRNDQVATITRMKVRVELLKTVQSVLKLVRTLLERSNKESQIPIIYYTHLQHAQIGSLGHYWLAQAQSFVRDIERFISTYDRVNISPLGSSACGGSRIPVDRHHTANLLGFDSLLENSLDAVTSRDFAFEALAALANLMIDVSRVCQDLILWSSTEFGYVTFSDEYASTSSVMPHKKNPDPLELAKAKCGEIFGLLVYVGDVLKGLPSGYNRDLQQIKPPIIQGFETVEQSIQILNGAISTLRVNVGRIERSLKATEAYAAELVEWLVQEENIPLRDAHTAVAMMVKTLTGSGRSLQSLKPKELSWHLRRSGLSVNITKDLRNVFDSLKVLYQRKTVGSPNPSESRRMLKATLTKNRRLEALLENRLKRLETAKGRLEDEVSRIRAAH